METFYDFFIDRFKTDRGSYSKAKLILNFLVVEFFVSLFYTLTHDYFALLVPQWLFGAFSIVVLGILLLFKRSLALATMAHIVVSCTWFAFVAGATFSGGIFSLALPWLALLPILSSYLISQRATKIWFAVSVVTILLFLLEFKIQSVPRRGNGLGYFGSHLGLIIVAFLFSNLYSLAQAKLVARLTLTNQQLQQQKEEVITQNRQLVLQRDELDSQRDHIHMQNQLLAQQNAQVEKVNRELAMRVQEIFQRNDTLNTHWKTLLEISKSKSINNGDIDEAICHIAKTAADSLKVDRVGVWQFHAESNSLRCLVLHDQQGEQCRPQDILIRDFPRYFDALTKERIIQAEDAQLDARTNEFFESYLKVHHVRSVLDTAYFLNGSLAGVVCCESRTDRNWLPEDILFMQALSDIVPLVFRAAQQRQYVLSIRSQGEEIALMNQNLEARIRERTMELEKQNQQMSEYAFINSHLLRAPLTRVMGLVSLMEADVKEKELIAHLKDSANELDRVVKKINNAIEKGVHFDRNELNSITNQNDQK